MKTTRTRRWLPDVRTFHRIRHAAHAARQAFVLLLSHQAFRPQTPLRCLHANRQPGFYKWHLEKLHLYLHLMACSISVVDHSSSNASVATFPALATRGHSSNWRHEGRVHEISTMCVRRSAGKWQMGCSGSRLSAVPASYQLDACAQATHRSSDAGRLLFSTALSLDWLGPACLQKTKGREGRAQHVRDAACSCERV